MRHSGSILKAVLLMIIVAVPATAQVNDIHIIPAVAHQMGAAGTTWRSSLYLFNPHNYPLVVSVTFLRTHGDIGSEVLVEIGPNETISVDDVLDNWFGTSGGGSLLVATFPEDNPDVDDDAVSRSVLVRSRTYNVGVSGTYGQAVPSIWTGLLDYEYDGITSIAHGVRNNGLPGFSGYRTNVGAVNLGDESVTLLLTVYNAAGDALSDTYDHPLEFILSPYAHEQQALPIAGEALTLEFFLDDPSQQAVVFPYATVVDNRTGDAEFIHPTLLASPAVLLPASSVAMKSGAVSRSAALSIEDARTSRSASVRIATIRSKNPEESMTLDRPHLRLE